MTSSTVAHAASALSIVEIPRRPIKAEGATKDGGGSRWSSGGGAAWLRPACRQADFSWRRGPGLGSVARMSKHLGSCLCGDVRFEILGAFERFFLCHCGRCRKDTGSAHAANLFSSTAKVRWLSGQSAISTYQVP